MEEKTIQFIFKYRNTFHGNDVKDEYKCVVCGNLLCDPYSAICGCSFCKVCMERQFAKDNFCPGDKRNCKNTNSDNGDFARNHVLRSKVNDTVIKCPNKYCSYNGKIEEVVYHFDGCEYSSDYSILGSCIGVTLEDDKSPLDKNVSNYLRYEFENERHKLANKIERMESMINTLEEKVIYMSHQNDEINNKFQSINEKLISQQNLLKMEKEMNNQMAKLILMQGNINVQPENDDAVKEIITKFNFPSNSASFIWKVENLPQKREEAKLGRNRYIGSNQIYMYPKGYKMGVGIWPNGDFGEGANTHLSAAFCICVGEFDEDLRWPLQQNISLSLINPTKMKESYVLNVNYETTPQNLKFSFDKPKNSNRGLYCYKFISWDELNSPNSPMVNGTIFVKLTLEKD